MSSMCLSSNRSQLGTNQNVQFLLAFLGVHLWAALYTYYVKVKKKNPQQSGFQFIVSLYNR